MNFYKKKVFKNLYPCTCVHVVCVHVIICSVNSEWNDIILIVLYIIIILYYVSIIVIIVIIVVVIIYDLIKHSYPSPWESFGHFVVERDCKSKLSKFVS